MLSSRRIWLAAGAIFLTTLAMRLWFIAESAGLPTFAAFVPGLDADLYWRGADHLLEGRSFSFELRALSAPLFAYIIAAWKFLFGDSVTAFRIFLGVQASLRALLLLWTFRRFDVPLFASVAVLLSFAFMPSLIYFDTMVLKSGVELSLLAAILWVLSGTPQAALRPAIGRGLALGALLVALFLSQLNTFLLVVPIAAFVLLDPRTAPRARLRTAIPMLGLFALCFGGALYRVNVGADPERFQSSGGVEIRLGFHEQARGVYTRLPDIPNIPIGHAFFPRIDLEGQTGRLMTRHEAETVYRNRAFDYIRTEPGRALELIGHKTMLFFNQAEGPDIHYLGWLRKHTMSLHSPIGFGALVTLACVGLVHLRRRRALLGLLAGLVFAVWVPNILTWVNWRFRIPAVLPLGLLAAFGLCAFAAARSHKQRALLLLPALVGAYMGFSPAFAEHTQQAARIAEANASEGQRAADMQARLAALGTPGSTSQEIERMVLLDNLHHYTETLEAGAKLSRVVPGHIYVARAYLALLTWKPDYESAARFYRELKEQHPDIASEAVASQQNPVIRRALERFVVGR